MEVNYKQWSEFK